MKIHNKGQVVIPSDLRKKYNLEIGDEVDFISDESGIHIYPNVSKANSLRGSIRDAYQKYGRPSEKSVNESLEKGLGNHASD
ncbi:MAG: AbrB/MazE/SpoVT family DNA-binding domain-containing protein [Candidatus Marinimicrobia bacterium]|nr:AbrB/MazE/SpoVT family DNA-binding domain-containing protein [Candidatus Neomarinimicrobiota bacterium]